MNEITRILTALQAGRRPCCRAALAAGLRGAAQAGRPEAGAGEARADAAGHGAGARGVPAAGGCEEAQHWNSRGHFFAAAAEAMRRILVESARDKQRLKHGGGRQRVDLDETAIAVAAGPATICSPWTRPWSRLAREDPQAAELVKLRVLRRADHRRGGRGAGHLAAHRRSSLGLRPGLAALELRG